ncbi:MAG: tRNA(Ile)-lysidine synthase [Lentimonas sp.]|jgi:tRNA(Ile)-lysidine synthase
MGDFCQKNKIKHLFLGHHQDDLAENFLIRLFRGSGIDGLAAMNKITNFQEIKLIRPFLEFSKTDLTQYLQNKKISWVEDESNEDEKFLRNKIRNFLKNLPDSEIINSRISLASNAILEAKEILQKETKKNFPKIFRKCDVGFLLDLEKFRKLEKMVATRYLSFALMKISQRIYKPRFKKLERIYQLILDGKLSKKEEFYGCLIEGASEEFCRELSGAFMGAGTLLLRPKT